MVENLTDTIPINGMKMTFPTNKNYALRYFELFDISKICENKKSDVLTILERLLEQTKLFYNKKKIEGSQFCRDFANSIHSDLKLYDELVENLLIIDRLENKENELNNQALNKIDKFSRSIDVLIEKKSCKIQSKSSIYENSIFYISLRQKLNSLGRSILDSDIKKSIEKLKSSRDKIEIFVLTTLTQILLVKEEVTSREIFELVNDFSKLKLRIENFSNTIDFVYNFNLPIREMMNIITIVDPILSNNSSISKTYSHLIMVSKWVLSALDIIYYQNFYQDANKFFAYSLRELEVYGKILHLLNFESQDIKIRIDRKENLDTIRKLIETLQEMKEFVENTIEKEKIEDTDNQIIDYNEEHLNNSLLKEKQDVIDLYSNFTKGRENSSITFNTPQITKASCMCKLTQFNGLFCPS